MKKSLENQKRYQKTEAEESILNLQETASAETTPTDAETADTLAEEMSQLDQTNN